MVQFQSITMCPTSLSPMSVVGDDPKLSTYAGTEYDSRLPCSCSI